MIFVCVVAENNTNKTFSLSVLILSQIDGNIKPRCHCKVAVMRNMQKNSLIEYKWVPNLLILTIIMYSKTKTTWIRW